jgi:hypothetical protein
MNFKLTGRFRQSFVAFLKNLNFNKVKNGKKKLKMEKIRSLGAIHKQRLLIGGGRGDPLRADERR